MLQNATLSHGGQRRNDGNRHHIEHKLCSGFKVKGFSKNIYISIIFFRTVIVHLNQFFGAESILPKIRNG